MFVLYIFFLLVFLCFLLFFVNLCQLKFKHFSLLALNAGERWQGVSHFWCCRWYLFGHLLGKNETDKNKITEYIYCTICVLLLIHISVQVYVWVCVYYKLIADLHIHSLICFWLTFLFDAVAIVGWFIWNLYWRTSWSIITAWSLIENSTVLN